MGGGRQCLQSNISGSEADPKDTYACYSTDGRDLIKKWISDKTSRSIKMAVASNTEELFNVDSNTDYLLGNF